jgi:hypothetical protein
MKRSVHARSVSRERVGDAAGYGGEGCLVEDPFDAAHGFVDSVQLGYVALKEIDPIPNGFKVGRVACAQVIQDASFMAPSEQRFDQVGSDESGSAGD